jgi:hypothetical protein
MNNPIPTRVPGIIFTICVGAPCIKNFIRPGAVEIIVRDYTTGAAVQFALPVSRSF